MGKTSFVIHKTWIPLFLGLTAEQAGELIQSIMRYQNGELCPPDDNILCAIFQTIRAEMDEDNEKYNAVCAARAAAGQRGGQAKASNHKQNVASDSKSKQVVAKDSKAKQNLPDSDCEGECDSDIYNARARAREKDIPKKGKPPPVDKKNRFNRFQQQEYDFDAIKNKLVRNA